MHQGASTVEISIALLRASVNCSKPRLWVLVTTWKGSHEPGDREGGKQWRGWLAGVRVSGTLSAGATGVQPCHAEAPCHAERSEASRHPTSETFAAAQVTR